MTPESVVYVQIVATVVVTIANVLLTIFTFNYVRLTGRMVEHMQAQRMGAVIVDLEFDGWSAYFTVGNDGTAPVTGIHLEVEDNVKWSRSGVAHLDVVKHGISYLPAGRTLKFFLGPPDWKSVEDGRSVVRVGVTYKTESQLQQRQFAIDMAQYLGSSSKTSPADRLVRAVEELARAQRRDQVPRMLFMESKKLCVECAEKIPSKAKRCSHCAAPQPAKEIQDPAQQDPAQQVSDHEESIPDHSEAAGTETDGLSEARQQPSFDTARDEDPSSAADLNGVALTAGGPPVDLDASGAPDACDENEANPETGA